jgi:hypothetical protein
LETLSTSFGRASDGRSPGGCLAREPVGYFGIYDEGDGLLSLYATPIDTGTFARAIRELAPQGTLFDITPERGALEEATEVGIARIAEMNAPLEVLHAPSPNGFVARAPTLMAAPHHALPPGSGRALAFSLQDVDHGVLYSRDRNVVRSVLGTWLARTIERRVPIGQAPPMPPSTLDSVLSPLPPQAWRQVGLDLRARFWSLDVSVLVGHGTGHLEVVDELRWVGGPNRAWRAGWTW